MIGGVRPTGYVLADLGIVALHEANYEQAATLFQEGLRVAQQVEDEMMIAQCLWGMAIVAAENKGQAVRAIRLWGAAVHLRVLDVPPFMVRSLEERLLTPLRDTLGREFAVQWATGQALPVEDAIAYALRDTDP
jgi:hypothetical protein